ncbi:unnamed protein product [Cuscuta epithymum]|uniref:Uncharacterized protein n=1 Tax=Cuscuta epithymum TaxID=186058 RepID=A0AAV0F828_9ASTE|nr:unnamed protein product [Cuscuta epithymum]
MTCRTPLHYMFACFSSRFVNSGELQVINVNQLGPIFSCCIVDNNMNNMNNPKFFFKLFMREPCGSLSKKNFGLIILSMMLATMCHTKKLDLIGTHMASSPFQAAAIWLQFITLVCRIHKPRRETCLYNPNMDPRVNNPNQCLFF